ncbi:alpha-ketoacid dehydrogenase subunit beta [Streptomyces sp. NPDC050287]|uniref:alpha-ketoacid dehydrogenase subunit beta n=1 Tax=Streptomyces sp. NPDC050287 TaxID=3365608 RepID=UPI00378EA66C
MTGGERVAENLNRALHKLFEGDDRVQLMGEDVVDPYGGAFKVTVGLSSRFPGRVTSTPISEGAIVGVAAGLALCGGRPIVEIMFADFIGLCFDQIVNFASKSVAMYGRRLPMHMIVRCAVGGSRGYGPTHSQSPQKHFLGVPHLTLTELSPFHDNHAVLSRILDTGEPGILFEDKTLYTRRMFGAGAVSDLFSYDFLDSGGNYARVFAESTDDVECVIITPGGTAHRSIIAAEELLIEDERTCQLIVPSQLYPFDLTPLLPTLERADVICVVEESVAGGTWGNEVAGRINERLWGLLKRPVVQVSSAARVIPAAPHLEREVLIQPTTIRRAIRDAFDA